MNSIISRRILTSGMKDPSGYGAHSSEVRTQSWRRLDLPVFDVYDFTG